MNMLKYLADSCVMMASTLGLGLCMYAVTSAAEVPEELLAAVQASQHRIEAAGGGHRADNPGNGLQFQFGSEAVTVAPSTPGQHWQLALKLMGYGSPDKVALVAAASAAKQVANRLEFRRGTVTEWYENRPAGLEQGFTLSAPPEPSATTVVLDLAISGGLQPQLAADGQSVTLLDNTGQAALIYGDLHVVDAKGVHLPAKLALADGKVRIAVETQEARWPIVVDPLVKSAIINTGDASGGDRFGFSVAVSGTTAVVGAPTDAHTTGCTGCTNTGSAYVYVRDTNGTAWTLQGSELADLPVNTERRGYAVAIDGDTLILGAPGNSSFAGRAYVYTRASGVWSRQATLQGSNTSDTFFGASVAVYGNTAVVGEPGAHVGNNEDQGQVWVFTRSGTTWTRQATPIQRTSGAVTGDNFGKAVTLSGTRLLIGAPGGPPPLLTGTSNTGTGYAEAFNASGDSWISEGALTASGLAASDRFGWTVALYQLNDDPTTAMVGAPLHDYDGTHLNSGAAYAFVRSSGGTWSQQARLEDDSHAADDQFGYAVALGDGAAVIGVPLADEGAANAGEAYVWSRGTGSTWTEQQQLLINDASGHTPNAGDNFGWTVALAGNAPLVGAPNENFPATNHGTVNFYTFPCAFGRGYTPGQWMMISIPCTPATDTDTLGEIFGATNATLKYGHFADGDFYPSATWTGAQWTVMKRDPGQQSNTSIRLTNLLTDTLGPGTGYWLYSGTAPTGTTGQVNGAIGAIPLVGTASTASPLVYSATNPRCTSVDGCYEITLTMGVNRYNMVGNGLPFDVDWADVIVDNGTTGYTPTLADAAGLLSKNFWVYTGSSYSTFDDVTTPGTIRVMRSFFVKTLTATGTLKLLIPAKPSLKTSTVAPLTPEPMAAQPLPWYLSWLDMVVSPAAAEGKAAREPAEGATERDRHVHELEQALNAKQAWKVALSAEITGKSLRDTGNWLGQIPGAAIGFDPTDLPELPPLTPYLTLVFAHPEWGAQAGDYTTDYHPARNSSKAARTWTFEIRTDQTGQTVFLGWQGDPAIISRSTVTDAVSGKVFKLKDTQYRFGMPVFMANPVQKFIWQYNGDD